LTGVGGGDSTLADLTAAVWFNRAQRQGWLDQRAAHSASAMRFDPADVQGSRSTVVRGTDPPLPRSGPPPPRWFGEASCTTMVGITMGFTFGGFTSAMRPTRIRSTPLAPNVSTPDPDRLHLPEPPLPLLRSGVCHPHRPGDDYIAIYLSIFCNNICQILQWSRSVGPLLLLS
jgi:hypothetical protein